MYCDDNYSTVLNGRSESDWKGNLFFIGPRVCSVIDPGGISCSCFALVQGWAN